MYLPVLMLCVSQLLHSTIAIPATPPIHTTEGTIIQVGPEDVNLTAPLENSSLAASNGRRPKDNSIYPKGTSGQDYLHLHNFGRDLDQVACKEILRSAKEAVDDWITAAPRHHITPVEREHKWRSGSKMLTIKPNRDGYNLGELRSYIAIITALHAEYGGFWEWKADVVVRRTFGFLTAKGTAELKYLG